MTVEEGWRMPRMQAAPVSLRATTLAFRSCRNGDTIRIYRRGPVYRLIDRMIDPPIIDA